MVHILMVDSRDLSITESLDVRGWTHLDAVLLASLAIEAPLLLVGPHGTGKSLLVERMATALGLPMRHYNASLLNYDDLVGIPMPDESGENLNFISTPGTIWEAGFVFFDEISRCRADLQNKLFPIIHERKVVGIPLECLQHRWAAMNPPAPDDPTDDGLFYIGSEPLDPALLDRFPFVIPVPGWQNLTKLDRYQVVAWETQHDASHYYNAALNLSVLVDECVQLIPEVEATLSEWLSDYVLYVMDLLEQMKLPQSPRRARMFARAIVAIHAARHVLEGEDIDPALSAEIALLYGLPNNATEVPPSEVKLVALHRQAWEMKEYLEDDEWRQVMEEHDLARRIVLADELDFSDEDLSRLITQVIGMEDSDVRQIGLGTAMYLKFHNRRNLDPSAYEPLAQLAYHVLEPRLVFSSLAANSSELTLWNEIRAWLSGQQGRERTRHFHLERNFVLNGFPGMWRKHNWREALTQFKQDLLLFGIEDSSDDITE